MEVDDRRPYQGLLGRVLLMSFAWKITGYLTGAAATVVSAAVTLVSMFLIFQPRWGHRSSRR